MVCISALQSDGGVFDSRQGQSPVFQGLQVQALKLASPSNLQAQASIIMEDPPGSHCTWLWTIFAEFWAILAYFRMLDPIWSGFTYINFMRTKPSSRGGDSQVQVLDLAWK